VSVVFCDTETTGLDPDWHEIWEVGLISADGSEFEWQLAVDLGHADARALEISGYYKRRSRALEDAQDFASRFEELTRHKHLAGNVISFDEERLRKLLRANGACPGWHYHLVDIEALAAGKLGLKPPWDSEALSLALGVDPADYDRHSALEDARWAKAIYEAVLSTPSSGAS
jgi:DNA polymerase III epsilon subunit-like protein